MNKRLKQFIRITSIVVLVCFLPQQTCFALAPRAFKGRASSRNLADIPVDDVLEIMNPYVREHTQRVLVIAQAIGQELALNPEDQGKIEQAALAHDFGGGIARTREYSQELKEKVLRETSGQVDLSGPHAESQPEEYQRVKVQVAVLRENTPGELTREEIDSILPVLFQIDYTLDQLEQSGIVINDEVREIILAHHAFPLAGQQGLLTAILIAADVIENGQNQARRKIWDGRNAETLSETLGYLKQRFQDEEIYHPQVIAAAESVLFKMANGQAPELLDVVYQARQETQPREDFQKKIRTEFNADRWVEEEIVKIRGDITAFNRALVSGTDQVIANNAVALIKLCERLGHLASFSDSSLVEEDVISEDLEELWVKYQTALTEYNQGNQPAAVRRLKTAADIGKAALELHPVDKNITAALKTVYQAMLDITFEPDMSKVKCLILAGGRSERLRPFGSKQLGNLWEEGITQLDLAIKRARGAGLDFDDIYVSTTEELADEVVGVMRKYYVAVLETFEQVEEQIRKQIIIEPCPKGTAVACAYAARKIAETHGEDTPLLVLASDAVTGNDEADVMNFVQSARQAVKAVQRDETRPTIAAIALKIDRVKEPNIAYGFIPPKEGEARTFIGPEVMLAADQVEKPDLTRARTLQMAGARYNIEMNVWKIKDYLDILESLNPDLSTWIDSGAVFDEVGEEFYSFDDEVLARMSELADKGYEFVTVGGSFGWCDLGTWEAFRQVVDKGLITHKTISAEERRKSINNPGLKRDKEKDYNLYIGAGDIQPRSTRNTTFFADAETQIVINEPERPANIFYANNLIIAINKNGEIVITSRDADPNTLKDIEIPEQGKQLVDPGEDGNSSGITFTQGTTAVVSNCHNLALSTPPPDGDNGNIIAIGVKNLDIQLLESANGDGRTKKILNIRHRPEPAPGKALQLVEGVAAKSPNFWFKVAIVMISSALALAALITAVVPEASDWLRYLMIGPIIIMVTSAILILISSIDIFKILWKIQSQSKKINTGQFYAYFNRLYEKGLLTEEQVKAIHPIDNPNQYLSFGSVDFEPFIVDLQKALIRRPKDLWPTLAHEFSHLKNGTGIIAEIKAIWAEYTDKHWQYAMELDQLIRQAEQAVQAEDYDKARTFYMSAFQLSGRNGFMITHKYVTNIINKVLPRLTEQPAEPDTNPAGEAS